MASRSTAPKSGRGSKASAPTRGPTQASAAKPALYNDRPSDRLNPKTVDPFKNSKKSAFAEVYSTGGIPCRLVHGSVKHKLNWNTPANEMSFDPLLVLLTEGLQETVHPYYFVARQGFKELLEVENASDQAIPLLSRIAPPMKTALIHKDSGVFEASLAALVQLSHVTGPHLNPHLKMLIPALAKRAMDRKHKDSITDALQVIEQNCGKEALLVIKSKIPTYTSVLM